MSLNISFSKYNPYELHPGNKVAFMYKERGVQGIVGRFNNLFVEVKTQFGAELFRVNHIKGLEIINYKGVSL